jgi:hypothetical protein
MFSVAWKLLYLFRTPDSFPVIQLRNPMHDIQVKITYTFYVTSYVYFNIVLADLMMCMSFLLA